MSKCFNRHFNGHNERPINLTQCFNRHFNGRFIDAVRESYANYNEHGPRSNQKLRPIHQWVADELCGALEGKYVLESLRTEGTSCEKKIVGKYYDKNVDISISNEQNTLLAIVSVKFVTSNFLQNANNYFEHLMGETANIRRCHYCSRAFDGATQ